MTFATLKALHSVIGDALAEMERLYTERSFDYPSLDVPYYHNTVNPNPEMESAEKLSSEPAVVAAANRIVAACGQLAASVHRPFLSLMEGLMGGHLVASIQFLEATHTVEILRAAGHEGLHVTEISRHINEVLFSRHSNTGPIQTVQPDQLVHILRLLATLHWIREVRQDVFANNRLSSIIDSGKTPEQIRDAPLEKYEGTDCVAAIVALKSDEFLKSIAHLTDALLPNRERAVSLQKLDGHSQSTANVRYKTPFNIAFRTQLAYFEWLELPENKTRLKDFGMAMIGTRRWENTDNIIKSFPWGDLPQDAVVIDVGGGVGSTSMLLARAFPGLRFIVEDREQVVKIAPSVWSGEHAKLLELGRVSFRSQDFFQPRLPSTQVPSIGPTCSPSVFLIRACTHDWPDESVRTILYHLRNAVSAKETTKLFIVDTVLAHTCYDDGEDDGEEAIPGAERTLAPEGSPLLANLGRASASGHLIDLSMMAVLEGKERTLREISSLARSAGWRVSRMTRVAGSVWACITAEPV